MKIYTLWWTPLCISIASDVMSCICISLFATTNKLMTRTQHNLYHQYLTTLSYTTFKCRFYCETTTYYDNSNTNPFTLKSQSIKLMLDYSYGENRKNIKQSIYVSKIDWVTFEMIPIEKEVIRLMSLKMASFRGMCYKYVLEQAYSRCL